MTYLFIAFGLYLVYGGLVFYFQAKLIFPADMAGTPSKGPIQPDAVVIEIATDEGTSRGWYLPALVIGNDDRPRPLVVFFHGNAELIDHQYGIVQMYHDLGISVLLPEYRGYGHSDGSPSEAHIVADSLAMIDAVVMRAEVDRDQLVLHGRSIGGGLAAQVADRMQADQRKPAAVIVESTFVSVSGMAWRLGVPPLLVRSPLRTGQAFERSTYPVLIMHGKYDDTIPVSHAHELLKLAPNGKLLILDYGHGIPHDEAGRYGDAVRLHLQEAGVLAGNE